MGVLRGKVALITGGGTGIGRGIARAFAREGAAIVLASRNIENLERTAAEFRGLYGAVVSVAPADITVETQVTGLFHRAAREFGRLDILVNNSGTGVYAPLDELSLAEWDRVMAVNLTGAFLCTREAMKIMKGQRGGRIINIGSISSFKPRMDQSVYSASKAALASLTRSTALEGRAYGIAAGCLHPGLVYVAAESEYPERGDRPDEPKDIADAALAMAQLSASVNMLETTVMSSRQLLIGRG